MIFISYISFRSPIYWYDNFIPCNVLIPPILVIICHHGNLYYWLYFLLPFLPIPNPFPLATISSFCESVFVLLLVQGVGGRWGVLYLLYPFVNQWTPRFFHILTILNASVNIRVDISFWIRVFIFFEYLSRSGIYELYSRSTFRFLKTLHSLFHNNCSSTNGEQRFSFLNILANTCYLLIFW